jgi:hypothetical protein
MISDAAALFMTSSVFRTLAAGAVVDGADGASTPRAKNAARKNPMNRSGIPNFPVATRPPCSRMRASIRPKISIPGGISNAA